MKNGYYLLEIMKNDDHIQIHEDKCPEKNLE